MKFLYPLLAVLLAVVAVAPLEYPGAVASHTGLQATYNLIDLDQHPLQFVAWAPTVGQSFDLFRIDGPLPYVAAEVVHLVGFGYLDSVKWVYALAWLASALTMFSLARQFLSDEGAFLASVVYVFLPFHIAAVYVRGAFAESVAWAIFPLALATALSFEWPGRASDNLRQIALALLPTALLFLTTPGLAVLFSIAAAGIGAALRRRERDWRNIAVPIGGGLVLGLVLYLPTILRYGPLIAAGGFNPNYVLPFQLFSSLWGFGASTGSYLDQFPLQIGVVPLGLALVALALAARIQPEVGSNKIETPAVGEDSRPARTISEPKPETGESAQPQVISVDSATNMPIDRLTLRRALVVFLAAAVIICFATFELASPAWSVLGLFVSYPWQLLALVGLALAVVGGTAIDLEPNFSRPAMLAFFVALPAVLGYAYLLPNYIDIAPTRPQIAVFGRNEIALWDYRIVGPLRHGATLRVYLTWQALGVVDHDYTVFIHAVNSDGNTYGQVDSKPGDGTLPTYKWAPGQVVSDTHSIQINVDGPREGYHLELGLYQAANGQRAAIVAGGDALILPRPGDPEPVISEAVSTDSN